MGKRMGVRGTAGLILILAMPSSNVRAREDQERVRHLGVAALFGAAWSDAVTLECCQLRDPPNLARLQDGFAINIRGGEARVLWDKRTSTFVQIERSGKKDWNLSFPRPASVFPFSQYQAQR